MGKQHAGLGMQCSLTITVIHVPHGAIDMLQLSMHLIVFIQRSIVHLSQAIVIARHHCNKERIGGLCMSDTAKVPSSVDTHRKFSLDCN